MMNEKKRELLKPKFWMGLVWFAVVIAVMIFGMAPVQMTFGMAGVAITEVVLLILAVLPVFFLKWKGKEVFPFRRASGKQIIGTILIWLGAYLFVMLSTMVIAYFFPEELFGTSSALGTIFNSINPVVAFLIIAVMPAFCEEMLHRGLIRYTFKNVKNKWIVVTAMGIIFGIFHLDFVRFIPTAVLGAALTYVMLETDNILLPMLIHFINNSISAFATLSGSDAVTEEAVDLAVNQMSGSTLAMGSYCILAVAVPFLLLFGGALLRAGKRTIPAPQEEDASGNETLVAVKSSPSEAPVAVKRSPSGLTMKKLLIASICSALFFVAGVTLVMNGMKDVDMEELLKLGGYDGLMTEYVSQFDVRETQKVVRNLESTYPVSVVADGNYSFNITVEGGSSECTVEVLLYDTENNIIYRSGEAGEMTLVSEPMSFTSGDYILAFYYHSHGLQEDTIIVRAVLK